LLYPLSYRRVGRENANSIMVEAMADGKARRRGAETNAGADARIVTHVPKFWEHRGPCQAGGLRRPPYWFASPLIPPFTSPRKVGPEEIAADRQVLRIRHNTSANYNDPTARCVHGGRDGCGIDGRSAK
jgi:hypothetical protein